MTKIKPHCRIGKVKFKNKKLAYFPAKPRNEINDAVFRSLDSVLEELDGAPLAGYAIVAFNAKGWISSAWRLHKDAALPYTMLPDFARNTLNASVSTFYGDVTS